MPVSWHFGETLTLTLWHVVTWRDIGSKYLLFAVLVFAHVTRFTPYILHNCI